jgi:hypothetical protein
VTLQPKIFEMRCSVISRIACMAVSMGSCENLPGGGFDVEGSLFSRHSVTLIGDSI